MRVDIIKAWIKELLTGDAHQIQGQLGNCGEGRCCLGVLADVVFDKFPDFAGEMYERVISQGSHPSEQYRVIYKYEGTTDTCYDALPNNMWAEICGTTSWDDGDRGRFGSAPRYREENFDQCHAYGWNDQDQLPFRDIANKLAELYGLDVEQILKEK